MKKYEIGYTSGVYDMFHIGHLNLLKNAKNLCEFLIVAVSTDELVEQYKNKKPIIPFNERIQIINSIKYVDTSVAQYNMKKIDAWKNNGFDVIFVGDDWKNSDKWNKYEKEFNNVGVNVVYLPYTKHISSTKLRENLEEMS